VELIESVIGDDEPATPIGAALHETLDANKAEPEAAETATASDSEHEAIFVGNIKTLVYHEAASAHLPSEDNRQYFHSEAEAQQAGFRRAENE
jgi:methylphosphotriester-DNA--protein-cysteine methyltransferase